jgi:hypothetical protein
VIDGDMEKLREIFVFVCFALGVVALLLCVFQGWSGRVGSATALGATFVVCGVFLFLSQIKTFKVWEVQVELRDQLDQAQAFITQLRRISINSAKSIYNQAAWGNRMGSPSAREKQAQLDEIDKQLADLNLSPEEREDIARPVVRIIGFDLYQIFSRTLVAYAGLRNSALVERARSEKPEYVQARDSHSAGYTKWHQREAGQNPFDRLNTYDLKSELERETPREGEWLDDRELEITRRFAQEILTLYAGCIAKGGYTTEAAVYLDNYGVGGSEGYQRKAREVYGKVLADIAKQ